MIGTILEMLCLTTLKVMVVYCYQIVFQFNVKRLKSWKRLENLNALVVSLCFQCFVYAFNYS